MKVARVPSELEVRPRSVALGTFDGVHVGHHRVIETALSAAPKLAPTVVTFWPHPRIVLGNAVGLLTTLERRLELLAAAGIDETLVVEFTPELAEIGPETFVDELLRPIGTEVVVAGTGFRFGHARRGDLDTLEELGLGVRRVKLVPGVSSTAVRGQLAEGNVEGAARMLGRPAEVEGTVVAGDARGGTLGYPTANLRVDPTCWCPPSGSTRDRRPGIARRSRSARILITVGANGVSRRFCSISTGISTGSV